MTNETERDRGRAGPNSCSPREEVPSAEDAPSPGGLWTAQSPAFSAVASCDTASARDESCWRRWAKCLIEALALKQAIGSGVADVAPMSACLGSPSSGPCYRGPSFHRPFTVLCHPLAVSGVAP